MRDKKVSISKSKKRVKKTPDFPLLGFILSSAFLVACGFMLFISPLGYKAYKIQSESASWPTVIGTVIKSHVINHEEIGVHRIGDMYEAVVTTKYNVENQEYRTSEIFYNQNISNKSGQYGEKRSLIKPYPKGAKVPVSYDPNNHSIGYLETNVRLSTYFAMSLFLLGILIGLLILYGSMKSAFIFFSYYSKAIIKKL